MSNKEDFIEKLYPAAVAVSKKTGMSKELILAQAAQETGWGEHVLDGTNNIFNVKAGGGWAGPTKTFHVWEIENGKKVWKDQDFRVYGSVEEALQDRVKFLLENPRYAKAGLFDDGTRGDFTKEAAALQKAGCATDPNYSRQLQAVYTGPTMQRAILHAQQHSEVAPAVHPNGLSPSLHAGLIIKGDRGAETLALQLHLAQLGYTDAHGHALKPDADFGPNTRFAVEAFQRDHHLTMDGKVGAHTQEALSGAISARRQPRLDSAEHPGNAIYLEAQRAVYELDRRMGRMPDRQSDQLAGALAVPAQKVHLQHISEVVLSENGSRAFAVQSDALRKFAHVETAQAVSTTLLQSSQAWSQQAPEQVGPPAPNQAHAHIESPIAL